MGHMYISLSKFVEKLRVKYSKLNLKKQWHALHVEKPDKGDLEIAKAF